jgi:hypothetical protein
MMQESSRFYLSMCMLSGLMHRQVLNNVFSVMNIVPGTLSMNLNSILTKERTPARFSVQLLANLEEPSWNPLCMEDNNYGVTWLLSTVLFVV